MQIQHVTTAELKITIKVLLEGHAQKLSNILNSRQKVWLSQTQVNLNTRMRSALGRAFLHENRIELNLRLIQKHPEELAPTLAHELAHLIAPMIYGRRGLYHRDGWCKVIEHLGFAAERTHSLDVGELKAHHKVLAWAICGCVDKKHEIKSRVFRSMQRRRKYKCLKCKQELRLLANPELVRV